MATVGSYVLRHWPVTLEPILYYVEVHARHDGALKTCHSWCQRIAVRARRLDFESPFGGALTERIEPLVSRDHAARQCFAFGSMATIGPWPNAVAACVRWRAMRKLAWRRSL